MTNKPGCARILRAVNLLLWLVEGQGLSSLLDPLEASASWRVTEVQPRKDDRIYGTQY